MDPSALLRNGLLAVSRSDLVRAGVERAPVSRSVVRRFVAGTETSEAVAAASDTVGNGCLVTIDHLGEDTTEVAQASATRDAYLSLLQALDEAGLAAHGRAEVSLKLSALGQALPGDGSRIGLENARAVCAAAERVGTTVTLDMEDHTTVDDTLATLQVLRADFPWVGAVLQAYLHRTEADCADLAGAGSRVRLCKGAYAEPASVAYQERAEVDDSYRRCAQVLAAGQGYPMFATHDPAMIDAAKDSVAESGRGSDDFEFQMLYGIRPQEQRRLAAGGARMRVYLPYGQQWYGYLMRRMAERPANTMFFLRALLGRD
ncbi:proline dehydrogenase family protein [Dermacoccaceae bacterium W4C1]